MSGCGVITFMNPSGDSRIRDEDVNPRFASSAAVSPACAARPAWNGLHIEPNTSVSPDAWVAAMPSA